MDKIYDVLIIGGGPAGYTAAMYSARAGLDTLVTERYIAGGQMTQTSQIDNYPGFEAGIEGFELGYKMQQGAERFGAQTVRANVLSADLSGDIKKIETDSGILSSKSIIIATGAEHKHLGLANEEQLIGKGVGYCAACDGMFYKGKTVAVVGGGNSAAADAILLSKICRKVFLIHRRDTLRAEKFYHEPLMKTENIEFVFNSTVTDIISDTAVTGIKIKNTKDGSESEIACDGIFISIGRTPQTELFRGQLDLDKNGYIIADESTRTSMDGVFAAGDVRTKELRQIVTAVSDGASAAHFAEEYLETAKHSA